AQIEAAKERHRLPSGATTPEDLPQIQTGPMATTIDTASTADTALRPRPRPEIISHGVDRPQRGWVSWLTTTDHKRIGIMYLLTVLVFCILGGVETRLVSQPTADV